VNHRSPMTHTCTPPTKLGRSLLHTEVVGMSSLAAGIGGEGVDARDQVGSGTAWTPCGRETELQRWRFRGMVEVPYWEAKAEGTCRNSVDRYTRWASRAYLPKEVTCPALTSLHSFAAISSEIAKAPRGGASRANGQYLPGFKFRTTQRPELSG